MRQATGKSSQLTWDSWSMMLFMLIYLLLVLACLRQWGTPRPWSRVDLFSGSALVISTLLGMQQFAFSHKLPRAAEVKREAFGLNYDPGMAKLVAGLALAELLVFLDYGHWHLVPVLEWRLLQSAGLALYIVALVGLRWVDARLARNFADAGATRGVITDGPFRYIRHPRYACLIASRIAFALSFASIVGWLLVLGWVVVVRRRIRLEEIHLQNLFGSGYELYARRTARLLPGIY